MSGTVSFKHGAAAHAAYLAANYGRTAHSSGPLPVKFVADPKVEIPIFKSENGVTIEGSITIARYFARVGSASALYGATPEDAAVIDAWLEIAAKLRAAEDPSSVFDEINAALILRMYLTGHALTLADFAVFEAVRERQLTLTIKKLSGRTPHLYRWLLHLEALPLFHQAVRLFAPKVVNTGGSFEVMKLHDAAEGKVVTRFPPEPSGYLHLGHVKAALLNNYYARQYKGKLILRFDDTNPSKEKDEFVDNLREDLKRLEITPDEITFTSDHFDKLFTYAKTMITTGKAYVDDTPIDEMRQQRLDGVEGKNRNNSIEHNLEMFEEMIQGSEVGQLCCLRAKIDMKHKNSTMRDPVLYRCNMQPHHRTGTKYKAYPTYDFACPIVDSLEGVTHALRTSEYHQRNEQYEWVIDALGLRKPFVEEFGRLNFQYTVLSKRKLLWFVESGLVDGWNDPRFPTVQGMLRQGLTVPTLKEFILSQGASKQLVTMEWDKIWAMNKKYLDPITPRYAAVTKGERVPVRLAGGPTTPEGKSYPRHLKNPELGTKVLTLLDRIFIELEDAVLCESGEEVTLMGWGNAIFDKIEKDSEGKVTAIDGRLHLEGDVKKTKKKLHWVADTENLIPVCASYFEHLITKKKLEDDDVLEDNVNRESRRDVEMLGDGSLRMLKEGDFVQLERKGFFRCDAAFRDGHPLVLFAIPDGRIARS